ncbi:uncharacterized protein LOC129792462 [Lutzomyia longipalpis]|uniref:uncharacterized protein LOC129792462 n=1 Tax=Lutzomyia longipalpis TaxID=7200 RepID=UPI0024835B19|nr:uncharacterized protein LOC129792462 [Lutzomyia longipalpis]
MADVDRKLIFTYMGQCKGKEDLPVYLPDFKIEQANRNQYFMSGDIVVREPYPRGFSIFIDIKKCSNPSVADSCKTFLNNMATSDICTMLDLPLPSYSTFVRSLKPPLKCPIKQTTYHMDSFEVEDSLTKYMPVSRSISYWNVTIKARQDKKEVACISFQMHSRPVAKQSRRN